MRYWNCALWLAVVLRAECPPFPAALQTFGIDDENARSSMMGGGVLLVLARNSTVVLYPIIMTPSSGQKTPPHPR